MTFFALASLWGFLIGTGAVLGALTVKGLTLPLAPQFVGILALAVLLALAGGLVAAAAYRESSGRFR